MAAQGYIDKFGFSITHAGLLVSGWIPVSPELAPGLPTDGIIAEFTPSQSATSAIVAFLTRSDLGQAGTGVICLVKGNPANGSTLQRLTLRFGRNRFTMERIAATALLPESEIVPLCRALLASSYSGQRDELAVRLAVNPFGGVNTLGSLPQFVRIGIDELIPTRPAGALLVGWMLSWSGVVKSLALCHNRGLHPVDAATLIKVERLDALDSAGRDWGFDDSRCGFIACSPTFVEVSGPCWLRIECTDGCVGYATVPERRLRAMPAIRRIMDVLDVHDDDISSAYDVVGPVCAMLNEERLKNPCPISLTRFGVAVEQPSISLVIPLYGRVDYIEDQIATFSVSPGAYRWEVIYVLDDPSKRREALGLAESVFARFNLPFRLIALAENRGFAPACNAGLQAAQGEFVCFLNSDVVPVTPDFADRLTDRLRADPRLGMVAGLLLFEDGSVQHEGMVMQTLQNKGGLSFPIHPRKGWRPREQVGLEQCDLITGACMVLRRGLALQLGGFDERFIVGDFEDADFCLRLRATGAHIAVDHGVRLIHLERQSQTSPDQRWRNNITLFNAWLFANQHNVAQQPA